MNDWLYPLSRTSGCTFTDAAGKRYRDTSFDSFRQMMGSGSSDDWWYLATNFRRVEIGDRVWCYYGVADGDRGIVGLATIYDVSNDEKAATHDIHLKWTRRATEALLVTPVPADVIRRYVPRPRAPVWNLSHHPKLVRLLSQAAGIQGR